MEKEHHRLPVQVCGSVRKSRSTVSSLRQWLQVRLGRVSHTAVGMNRRCMSVEELHARVREQQCEQERQKAIEAEARRVVERTPVKDGVQETHAHQVHSPPGLSVRKDGSPIKVRVFRCFHCIVLITRGSVST